MPLIVDPRDLGYEGHNRDEIDLLEFDPSLPCIEVNLEGVLTGRDGTRAYVNGLLRDLSADDVRILTEIAERDQ